MARTYQISCPPGSKATIADAVTLTGGRSVTILNSHATEPLYVGGNENELGGDSVGTLSSTTGFKIVAGGTLSFVLTGPPETVWGRSGTTTVTITAHVFRTGT